jgi:hypothetical protein
MRNGTTTRGAIQQFANRCAFMGLQGIMCEIEISKAATL